MSGDRNEKAREELKAAVAITNKKLSPYQEREKANHLSNYVFNKLWGNRYASLAIAALEQIQKEQYGLSDGILCSKETVTAEYHLHKFQAVKAFFRAQINVTALLKLGLTNLDIDKYLQDVIDAPIFAKDGDYSKFDDGEDTVAGAFVDEAEPVAEPINLPPSVSESSSDGFS